MSFPSLTLTRVESIILPDFGAISHEDSIGRYVTRNPNKDGSGVELTLIFDYLSADDVLLLIEHYEHSKENSFGIPEITSYPSRLLQSILDLLQEVVFYYKEAPIIETMQSGVYSSSVTLRGTSTDLIAPSSISVLLTSEALLTCTCSSNVLWEQIGGADVDILSPNSLETVVRSQGGFLTGVDGVLTFRVSLVDAPYINRTVYLFTSPADMVNFSRISAYGEYGNQIPPWFQVPLPLTWGFEDLGDDISGDELVVIPVDSSVAGYFSWYDPPDTSNLSGFVIEYLEEGEWVVFKRVSYPSGQKACILYDKKPFRIKAIHSFPGGSDIEAVSPLLFVDLVKCSKVITGIDPVTGGSVTASVVLRAYPSDIFPTSVSTRLDYCNNLVTEIFETFLEPEDTADLLPKLFFVPTVYYQGDEWVNSYVAKTDFPVDMILKEVDREDFYLDKLFCSGTTSLTVFDVDSGIIG